MATEPEVKVTPPTVNLNGTSPEDLSEALETALSAMHKLRNALTECNPHSRDYPSEAEWQKARDQHQARQTALSGIQQELGALLESVMDQMEARQRR